MKKSLIALAALATVATAAQAQSSVTVYGLIDAGVRVDTNGAGDGLSKTSFGSGVLSTPRLGFKGSEDLGGGKKANFNLEMGISAATGANSQTSTSLFDRFAWVGISDAKLGEVQLGRNTNAGVHIAGQINAVGLEFEGNGTTVGLVGDVRANQVLSILGNTTLLGTTRSDSQIKYLNNFGPVNVVATYAIGGVAGDDNQKTSSSFAAWTTIGSVTLAGAAFQAEDTASKKLKYASFGGNVALGAAKLFAGYSTIESDKGYVRYNLSTKTAATAANSSVAGIGGSSNGAEGKVTNVGIQYNWDAKNLTSIAYFDGKYEQVDGATGSGKYKSTALTHKYSLSKRTMTYVSFDHGKIDGILDTTRATGYKSDNKNTGYGVGVIHTF